jgi:hypothetical protein
VSRLFPDRLAFALYPDRLTWLLVSGLRPHVIDKGELTFANDPQAMLQAIELMLKAVPRRTLVSIVLSNRLIRYTCVPNPDEARNASERRLLARHHFVRTHGAAAEQWDIALSHAAPGKAALASAVDSALIVALRDAVKRQRLRLVSLQPYLMAAFNAQAKNISKGAGLFAVAEPGRLCSIAWRDGGWEGVQQTHLEAEGTHEEGLLTRLRGMTGLLDEAAFHLCAPEFVAFHADGVPASPVTLLAGLSPTRDRAWAGAMLGVK